MMRQGSAILAGGLMLLAVVAGGCGKKYDDTTNTAPPLEDQLKAKMAIVIKKQLTDIGTAYTQHSALNGGRLPANEAELLQQLENRKDLLVSPRDKKPLVITYAGDLRGMQVTSDTVLVYEQEGKDGMRYVLMGDLRTIKEMSGQELQTARRFK